MNLDALWREVRLPVASSGAVRCTLVVVFALTIGVGANVLVGIR